LTCLYVLSKIDFATKIKYDFYTKIYCFTDFYLNELKHKPLHIQLILTKFNISRAWVVN